MKKQFTRLAGLCLLLLIVSLNAVALSEKDRILLKKNFYFLYLFEEYKISLKAPYLEQVRHRLENDAAGMSCYTADCYGNTLQFTRVEIDSIGNELVQMSTGNARIKKLINALRISGAYQLSAGRPDTGLIRNAWLADAQGINYILSTYIKGNAPLYPKIDAISFQNNDTIFQGRIAVAVRRMLARKNMAFYQLPLLLALEALRLNERDEAARYEPLTGKGNAPAYRRAKTINWDSYPYTAILVPGLGPETAGVKLDPNGARRCDSAVIRYRAGMAPFLIVSGGHVHPNKTPYCEAVEMKNYLVDSLHIPASAIIIEPHARHTTTNLRNASRIIYRFKMPAEKPVLIVTDVSQNNYINGNMDNKVMKELGYAPYSSINKLSAYETAYIPSKNSMQINSLDPLDP